MWDANLDWALGGRDSLLPLLDPEQTAAGEIQRLAGVLRESESEVQRVGAATTLGSVSRGSRPSLETGCADGSDEQQQGSAALALAALVECLGSGREATQRAAAYGCSVGGGGAMTEALGAAISAQLARSREEPADVDARAGTGAEYPWHVITSACFVSAPVETGSSPVCSPVCSPGYRTGYRTGGIARLNAIALFLTALLHVTHCAIVQALGESINQAGEMGVRALGLLSDVIDAAGAGIAARLRALPELDAVSADAAPTNGYYKVGDLPRQIVSMVEPDGGT